MPEFILDSSGIVLGTPKPWAGGGVKADGAWTFTALDAFTQGYIEALFFTEQENLHLQGCGNGALLSGDDSPAFKDLAPETLERIIEDCRKFQQEAREPLHRMVGCRSWQGSTYDIVAVQAGRDFWYTRNGHGCGFWDGDWPEPCASALDAAAKQFGNVDAYLGDDGKVYLS